MAAEEPWQRLDPRMLLVQPVRELVRFLPVLLGLAVADRVAGDTDLRWQLLAVLAPVLLGVLRYLTTYFRVHQGRVELRRGLVDRHRLSVPLDRVRAVDLTASPTQRLLGLTAVRIGTGTASTSDEDHLDLDGLPVARARTLREALLPTTATAAGPSTTGTVAPAGGQVVLRLDPRWARYAPLTLGGLAVGGAVVGVGVNLLGDLQLSVTPDDVPSGGLALWWGLGVLVVLAGLAAVSGLAVAGYLVTNWGFTLTDSTGPAESRAWHLRRGLLTTRETTIAAERLAGVDLVEPVGLRLAGAARLSAIVTGLERGEDSSGLLSPPAPRGIVTGVATAVVGAADPVSGPLVPHGPAAVRRRYGRALGPGLVVAAAVAGVVALGGAAGWLVVSALAPVLALLLARDRARALGHSLVGRHLTARSGSLLRRRQVLDTAHVIGWSFRATWFQRRAGLTSLVATTAGGPQAVTFLDVPEETAVALADRALPGLVDQFLA
jgi:putative membrane protein